MFRAPFQNSRSAFLGLAQPTPVRGIFRPQPAFMSARPAFREPPPPPGAQFGQLQGGSGPNPPSLEQVLAQRGFTMPERPTGYMTRDVRLFGPDPVTGRMRQGSSGMTGYYSALDKMYAENPEALEIAKQYTADPTQFGGKPAPTRSLKQAMVEQTLMPPLEMIQRPGGSALLPAEREAERRRQQPDYSQQIQEMQSMMREMMQMISALSGRGQFGGGFYSPRQQMMFGGIGSIPMSRGLFF